MAADLSEDKKGYFYVDLILPFFNKIELFLKLKLTINVLAHTFKWF